MSPGEGGLYEQDSCDQRAADDFHNQQPSENAASPSREEKMEAEIRRLEELNRIDAQRLREPATTTEESPGKPDDDELRRLQEEETKANCPDEYNLLSADASGDAVESIEALKETSGDMAAVTTEQT